MRSVQTLKADESINLVSLEPQPSPPLCPLAMELALDARDAFVETEAQRGETLTSSCMSARSTICSGSSRWSPTSQPSAAYLQPGWEGSKVTARPSYLYLLPHLLRALLRKPATVSYPRGPLELPAAYRGRLVLDIDACRGCGLCARDCPAEALQIERLGRQSFRIVHYYDRCANCGQCVLSCGRDAIHLEPSFERGAAFPRLCESSG